MPRSLQVTRFGGPEVLAIAMGTREPLGSDDVRIAVEASGVNFADIMMRMGLYPEAPKLPFAPGYEVAGTITETGSAVSGLKTGDRVLAGSRFGGYADEVVLPSFQVRKIPPGLSAVEAASIPVNFMTAWVALMDMARVRPGDRVLVQSAAGGVGVAAVQLAARAGATVVGLVGSPAKADAVKGLGASEVWTNKRWERASDDECGGFDAVLDPTGGASVKRSFRRLAPGGRVVVFGAASIVPGQRRSLWATAKFVAGTPFYTPFGLMNFNKGVFGLNMLGLFDPVAREHSLMGRAFDQVLDGFEKGLYRTVVGREFPLEHGGEAQAWLQSRANIGKVVLTTSTGH